MLVGGVGKALGAILVGADVVQRFRPSKPSWTLGSDATATASVLRDLYGDASFLPTPWLGGLLGGHLQTVWYGLSPKYFSPNYPFTEDVWTTADGGTLGLAWPEAPAALSESAPVVLVLCGLCGSITGTGHVTRAMMAAGLRPVYLHTRGCGQDLTSPCFNIFGGV
mgnify:FL=1